MPLLRNNQVEQEVQEVMVNVVEVPTVDLGVKVSKGQKDPLDQKVILELPAEMVSTFIIGMKGVAMLSSYIIFLLVGVAAQVALAEPVEMEKMGGQGVLVVKEQAAIVVCGLGQDWGGMEGKVGQPVVAAMVVTEGMVVGAVEVVLSGFGRQDVLVHTVVLILIVKVEMVVLEGQVVLLVKMGSRVKEELVAMVEQGLVTTVQAHRMAHKEIGEITRLKCP